MLISLLTTLLLGAFAEVHNPRIPVIVDRPYNIISEIRIPLSQAAEVDGVLELSLDGIPRKAVRSVRLMYTGTAKPLYSGTRCNVFRQHFNRWFGGWSLWSHGGGGGGLRLRNLGLALGGEVGLGLDLGGLLGGASGSFHIGGNRTLLRGTLRSARRTRRGNLRLALGALGLLGGFALGALSLAAAAFLCGLCAIFIVRALDNFA
jgi:hypothetical protein